MIINGVEYKNVPITFNTICQLEERGVNVSDMGAHMMSAVRAYAAICMRKSESDAGKEIEAHIVNGGELNDIIEPFSKEVEKSDFFQKLAAKARTETPDAESEDKTKA